MWHKHVSFISTMRWRFSNGLPLIARYQGTDEVYRAPVNTKGGEAWRWKASLVSAALRWSFRLMGCIALAAMKRRLRVVTVGPGTVNMRTATETSAVSGSSVWAVNGGAVGTVPCRSGLPIGCARRAEMCG